LSQEERLIFWEVTVSVILSKKYLCTCVLFRTVSEIGLFHCSSKIVDKKEILRTISSTGIYFSSDKVGTSTSMHFASRVRTWRVARLCSVLYSEIAPSRKPFRIGHMYIYTFMLRMRLRFHLCNYACNVTHALVARGEACAKWVRKG
jgi:hypothetical protein